MILPPSPLSSINFFATGNFLEHSREVFSYKIFRHCETKNFRRKILILPPPFLIHKLFRYRKFSGTQHRRVPLRNDSVLWDKTILTEIVNPAPSLIPNIFRYPELMKHWRIPLRNFSALWDKKFSMENCDTPSIPPLIHKLFRYRKFSGTQQRRVPLGNFSALWDKNFSTENCDTPSIPPLIHKLFRYRKFSGTQQRRVPLRSFSALWDKKNWQKIVIPAPSLIPNIFRYQNFSETQNGSSTKFFGTVRQKFCKGKSWYPFA